MYLSRLDDKIRDRVEGLRAGSLAPDELLVPGARRLVEALRNRGLQLYLASGTDQPYLRGSGDCCKSTPTSTAGSLERSTITSRSRSKFSIGKIISESDFAGEEFLAFGDGYVEIQNIKQVGGVAVGVATDEPRCVRVDEVKRRRLLGVGADWLIPNFSAHDELMHTLFP